MNRKTREYIHRFVPPAIFILTAVLLLYKALPSNPIWITDNGNKYIITRTIAEYGSANIRHILPELFPRGGFHFHVLNDGMIRSFHSELLPALTAPFYRIAGDISLHFLPLAATLGMLLVIGFRLKKPLLLCGILFSTPIFFYSLLCWEMTPSIFFSVAAALLLLDKRGIQSGAVIAIGIWFREELYFLAFAMFCALLIRREWKTALRFALSCAALTAVYWGINHLSSGHILGLHGKYYALNNRTAGNNIFEEIKGVIFNFYQHLIRFETMPGKISLPLALSGAAGLLAAGSQRKYNSFPTIKKIALGWYIITEIILAAALWTKCNEPLYTSALTMGLIAATPIAAGFMLNWRALLLSHHRGISLISTALVIYILLVPPFLTRFDIGLTWGARHFFCIMAMLAVLSFHALRMNFPNRVHRSTVWIMLMISALLMQLWAVTALIKVSNSAAEFQQKISALPEQTVLTDIFFIPEQTPELLFEKDILEITDRRQLETALEHLRSSGKNSFILMLSQKFRRIDNESIAYLMQHSQIISEPQKLQLNCEQEIFIFRCRLR